MIPLLLTIGPASWLAVAFLTGGAVVGLALLGAGALALQRWWVLGRETADQFRAGLDGPIEITGVARPAADADPFTAAVSRTACLVCEIQAQKYESDKHGGDWVTLESRTTTRPFVVETGVGDIRVEPDGAGLVLVSDVVASVARSDEATGYTAKFFDAVGVAQRSGSLDIGVTDIRYGGKYRVREARVDVGEDVYVAGHATVDDATVGGYRGPDAVVRALPDRPLQHRLLGFPFVVGDGGEAAVRRHFRWRGLGLVLAGLCCLGIAVGVGLFVA